MDGLLPRLRGYSDAGAQFAKWRAVLRIGPGMPSALALRANAQALGRYAAACQDAGLVPIVAPEVLMCGSHSLGHFETVTSVVLLEVMSNLHDYGVAFENVVLMPAWCCQAVPQAATRPRPTWPRPPSPPSAACPPPWQGWPSCQGAASERATGNMAAMQHTCHLWPLTFSFGRALTGPALAAW